LNQLGPGSAVAFQMSYRKQQANRMGLIFVSSVFVKAVTKTEIVAYKMFTNVNILSTNPKVEGKFSSVVN
jgi:hypothetical protein